MSQLRGDYKSVWNSLSGSKQDAYLVVSGYTDEDKFHADAEDTIDVLRETVGIHPEDTVLEIGCGVGRVGRVLSPFVGATVRIPPTVSLTPGEVGASKPESTLTQAAGSSF